jgi:anti-sigma regulatory factor (Ser/Thr protein kinase)
MYLQLSSEDLINDLDLFLLTNMSNLSEDKRENFKIALGEVLQNIIRHGYKNKLSQKDFIEIQYQILQKKLIFIIRDYSHPCDPQKFLNKHFSPNESGHMGLSIIKKLTDDFSINPLPDGNETTLIFNIE